MLHRWLLTSIVLIALAGCSPATAIPLEPSRIPDLPTETLAGVTTPEEVTPSATPENNSSTPPPATMTLTLTEELPPTETRSVPLPTLAHPTAQATSIPQPKVDSGAIQFYSPGPLSRVISPVKFYGYAIPGYDRKGRIELFGEDGTLLASELLQLNTDYKWAYFYWEMEFEARGAGELGRLSLTTRDQYGRPTSIQSVHLILLPNGTDIINPPGDLAERCVIESPAMGKRITGGIMAVSGLMKPFNSLPLIVELVGRDGSVLGSQLVPILPNPDGYYTPFQVAVPYKVTASTPSLLSVRQSDDRIGGTIYLYSQEVTLNP